MLTKNDFLAKLITLFGIQEFILYEKRKPNGYGAFGASPDDPTRGVSGGTGITDTTAMTNSMAAANSMSSQVPQWQQKKQ